MAKKDKSKKKNKVTRADEAVGKVSDWAKDMESKAKSTLDDANSPGISKDDESIKESEKISISEANKVKLFADRANGSYEKARNSLFNIFNSSYYELPPEPYAEDLLVFTDDDTDEVVGLAVSPRKKDGTKNKFEYYDQPSKKALFARILVGMVLIMIMMILIVTQVYTWGMAASIILLAISSILLGLRQANFGFFGLPIKLPAWLTMTTFEDEEDDEDIEELEEEDLSGLKGNSGVQSNTEPIDGVKSPGIYLADWINYKGYTKKMFSQESGLEVSTVSKLINDNEDAWTDKDVLMRISETTSTTPDRWIEGLRDWYTAQEENDER